MAELVAVLVVLGTVATVAVPRVSGALAFRRADGAAREVAAVVTRARERAMASGSTRVVLFDTDGETCIAVDASGVNGDLIADLQGGAFAADLVSAEFVYADGVTVSDSIGFDAWGRPVGVDDDGAVSPGSVRAGGVAVIGAGGHRRAVRVDGVSGVVTLEGAP